MEKEQCVPIFLSNPPCPPLKKGERRVSLEKGGGFSLEKSLSDQTYQTFPPFLKGD
ncbi:MAG: hypothetical protein JETT_1857 [Candidatus Jettenia ecosi]|uniref:Uncharacterized protein n=1 Tax=Candidatus Jettenia ecosi TaxID=2494326 RepID=A0A533QMN2_9BACT|nr:MAG: hypothetical protein JETT_1857 [Candidatus Jettenia ecosi]